MIRWFRSLFAWRDVRYTGIWMYQQNTVTGARRALRVAHGGYQPIDYDWLLGRRG